MNYSDLIAYLWVAALLLSVVVGFIFLVSGLDDLFIDCCYAGRTLYRRLFIYNRHQRLCEQDLYARPEQPIAVMVPAWDESAVIRKMLLNTLRNLDYLNYVIFVGTYPNDGATQSEVRLVEEAEENVVGVILPHDGPTNKADCLNWIYHGILRYEVQHGVEFQVFVMQDCEDVIHPLCYRLFNLLIPRKDMVQLPVLSLRRKWYEFTGGHYLDEFAQLHYKDLVVREMLDRSLPAAGVGVAFSRRALATTAVNHGNAVFSTRSLTEDYDLGYRLKRLNMQQIFVKFEVRRVTLTSAPGAAEAKFKEANELVGVREFFPATLRSAVKQKSRWVIGIALQGWAHIGWAHGLTANYMLYRDRKALVTNLATVFGYLLVVVVSVLWFTQWLSPGGYRYPALVTRGSVLWYLLIANMILLVSRVVQRAYCVGRLYGPLQAALSLPRMVWANVINFAATARAIRIYARALRTGKPIAWDKTSHSYPDVAEVAPGRRRLGEVLLNRGLVTAPQLENALALQRTDAKRLGETLVDLGVLTPETLQMVLNSG